MTQDPNVFTSFIFTWHHICVVDGGLSAHTTKACLNAVSSKASLSRTLARNKMRNMFFFPARFFTGMHAWLSMFSFLSISQKEKQISTL